MPTAKTSASVTSFEEYDYGSDDANRHREHARTLVKMADMVTRSTEKVERKVSDGTYEESAAELLGGSDPFNLDLESPDGGVADKGGDVAGADNEDDGNDSGGAGGAGARGGGGAGSGDDSPPHKKKASKRGSSISIKKSEKKEDSPGATSTAETSSDDLGISADTSDASLRDQLTQTRKALLQVRENAKLKYRKLELEHTTVKKELKKAKNVIEKQTVEYKKLKVKLEGVEKERDDSREELARELGGRGSLVSGISQENGRMIRRLREVRAERDKLEQERDELKQALERCTCDAGQGHEFTLTSSLAHETVPIHKASALSQRHFVTESRRNVFESARYIRSNFSDEMEHEIQATKEEIARRRSSNDGGSGSFSKARPGQRSYLRPGEEKIEHDYDNDDDDQSTMSFISMSVRSLPVNTKKKIDQVWASTSMRLGNEIDGRSRGKRSYHRNVEGQGDEAGGKNIAPRGEPSTTESSDPGKSFWAATSQRFLMGIAQEIDE